MSNPPIFERAAQAVEHDLTSAWHHLGHHLAIPTTMTTTIPFATQEAPMADTLHAAIYRDVMTRLDAVVKDAIDRWLTPDNMLGAVGDVLDTLRHQQAPTPPPPPAAVQDTAPDVVQPADADADPAA